MLTPVPDYHYCMCCVGFMNSNLRVLNELPTIFTVDPLELLAGVSGLVLLDVLGRVEDLSAVGAGILLPKLATSCIIDE